jgi:flagellum-specific peptidoglycan hydrolase FlgJ
MLTRKAWIDQNAPFAIEATKGSGIFPETLLAMAIVESQGKIQGNWYPGEGLVAKKANNFFGIKKGSGWTGKTISLPTPGDADKISVFRVYPNFEASARDYVRFLQVNPRYKKAGVFSAKDYVEQIVSIARAGYAESPSYTSVVTAVANSVKKQIADLIKPIEENGKIAPLLIAGFIVTLYIFKNKFFQNA